MRRRDFFISATAALTAPMAARNRLLAAPRAWLRQNATDTTRFASGPLRKHPDNPRYFANAQGEAVLLTGSHTWNSLVDVSDTDPPAAFDFGAYLNFLERYQHNFIRLWTWESTSWDTRGKSWGGKEAMNQVAPQPWARTGPGTALDGKPKFDLEKFDPDYFERLRTRVAAAGQRGFYVSVMLFEGWAMQFAPEAWKTHPFHPANNINSVGGDLTGDGPGLKVHELASRGVTQRQEAYVRQVVDTVNDLDNVLYEISNENHPASTAWQYHFIDFVHECEKQKPHQHPVGMTFQYKGGSNRVLFDSPADWISPNPDGGYRDDPPAADGGKVILTDTDHLWGIGGNQAWVWRSFLRGLNPLFMDPYDGSILGKPFDPQWEPIRRNLGYARQIAESMPLAAMVPHNDLASTRYCLARPGSEYLVYLPEGGEVTVDLTKLKARATPRWFDPTHGKYQVAPAIQGGASKLFRSPLPGDAVLHIRA